MNSALIRGVTINQFILTDWPVAYPRILFGWGGSTNSVGDRGQRERGSGGGSPLVRGSTQFSNEWNPYFVLGCYGCIFHGTGNLAQLCQNFEISGWVWTSPPQHPSVRHCDWLNKYIFNVACFNPIFWGQRHIYTTCKIPVFVQIN
jgi:hypothetical protein